MHTYTDMHMHAYHSPYLEPTTAADGKAGFILDGNVVGVGASRAEAAMASGVAPEKLTSVAARDRGSLSLSLSLSLSPSLSLSLPLPLSLSSVYASMRIGCKGGRVPCGLVDP